MVLSNTMGSYQLAHGPFTIDAEDEQSLLDRWTSLFASGDGKPPAAE